MKNISQSVILDMPIAIPGKREQDRISEGIIEQLANLNLLGEKVKKALVLLQERRTAIISAAVTGQIDVRGFQPVAA